MDNQETSYKDIEKAKAELERAHENLVKSYVNQIPRYYANLSEFQRESLLSGLETIIQKLESKGDFEIFIRVPHARGRKPLAQNLAFSRETARALREKAGLSQTALAKELGQIQPALLHAYESGRTRPSNPPRGEFAPKYLKWLKEHGYNPFNL